MTRSGIALLPALASVAFLAAQQSTDMDEENLFGSPEDVPDGCWPAMVVEAGGTGGKADEGTEIGGRFRFKTSSSWNYDGIAWPWETTPSGDALALDLGAAVFLDARPAGDFRVFGKVDVSYPFADQGGARRFDEVFHVKELFCDFQLGDAAFFRAGKQTIHWGVGRFFSPADLPSITGIDPEDPDAEREGPLALRTHVPLGVHNLYLYTIFEDASTFGRIALAPKAEFVWGGAEIGLGAFYRQEDAPAGMVTFTANVLDFRLFAEGILSYGSNRTFVVEDPAARLGVGTAVYGEGLYPAATAGVTYRYDDDLDLLRVSVTGQYLYNGEGYEDPDLFMREAAGIAALAAAGWLSASDLAGTGRHYGAVDFAWSGAFGSDFSLGCLWLGNLSDGSGTVNASLGWSPSDEWTLSLKAGLRYGEAGGEYTPRGEAMTLVVSASLGGGSF